MKAPVPLTPARFRQPRPPSRPTRVAAQPAAVPQGRAFADEGSLWESFWLRLAALREDCRIPEQREPLLLLALFAALLVFSYWPGLLNARAAWSNPQYSHGWLVPLFSIVMLFWWRQPIQAVSISARAAGAGLLVASVALRLAMARYRIITVDMYTFVPALAGVALMVGGWSLIRWAILPIGFLIFMYPLPDEATRYLLGPLQTLATAVSTYGIQTLGVDAYREGNQIIVGDKHLGVVDACSGLRMLTIFIALSAAIVMLSQTNWLESGVILASSVPIALLVNAIRITLTGVMYTISPDLADKLFHDWAGYFMMPLALGLLYLEQWLFARLVVAPAPATMSLPAMLTARAPVRRPPRRRDAPGRVVSPVGRPKEA